MTKSLKFNAKNFYIHFDESSVSTPLHLIDSSAQAAYFSVPSGAGSVSVHVVQASTNLRDWVSLMTNTSPFTFFDQGSTNLPGRYYRAFGAP